MRNEFFENLELSNFNSLNICDVSFEILERMKFLDKKSHDYSFKEYENQVVVETKDYFYKVYIDYGRAASYLLEIRKKLSEIYRSYGVDWELLYNNTNGFVITIQQREKLRLCKYSDMTCEKLLKEWKKTIDLLKESLSFDDILSQIKERSKIVEFRKAKDILLVKQSLIKPEDYAYAPNGNIILLDDADFMILVIGEDGKPISKNNFSLDVMSTCGEKVFSSNKDFLEKSVCGRFNLSNSFFIFDKKDDDRSYNRLISNSKDTDEKKLKLFVTGKPSNTKYQNEYLEEYNKRHNIMLNGEETNYLNNNV